MTSVTSSAPAAAGLQPRGPRPQHLTAGRIGIYAFLVISAVFFLIPLIVMLMTSMKSMEEIHGGNIFALPMHPTFDYWVKAWSSACTGRDCFGLAPGFFNSVKITVISVPVSILAAMLSGYSLSFWKYKGSELFFTILVFGAFVPYQVLVYPIIFGLSRVGLFGTLPGLDVDVDPDVRLRRVVHQALGRARIFEAQVAQILRVDNERRSLGGGWRLAVGDAVGHDGSKGGKVRAG